MMVQVLLDRAAVEGNRLRIAVTVEDARDLAGAAQAREEGAVAELTRLGG